MYHSVTPFEEDPFQVTVSPERFERQLEWLHNRKLRGTSMRELLEARRSGDSRGLVGLTVDDGYGDFATFAMPALARHGFTATVFVIAGDLGGHNSWDQPGPRKALMTAEQVKNVAAAGIEIGSHGLHHTSLVHVDQTALTDEVAASKAALENVVGDRVTGFSYPYGDVTARVADAVRAAGYDYACAVRPGGVGSRYALPRTYVGNRDGFARLDAKRLRHELTGTLGGGAWTRRAFPAGAGARGEHLRPS